MTSQDDDDEDELYTKEDTPDWDTAERERREELCDLYNCTDEELDEVLFDDDNY